jgi:GT2 family glycosyltransferase
LYKVLCELDYPKDQIEVIVCDNASTDGTSEMLSKEFPSVKHIKMPANLWTQAWNWGFANSSGEYFLVLDDDAHIQGNTLKKSIRFLEKEKNVGILSFNVIDPTTRYSYTLNYPLGIFSFWGCAAVIRKSLFEIIGGFDPNIRIYSHEPDFIIRALKSGYKHHVMIDLTAYHRKNPAAYNQYDAFKLLQSHLSDYYTYLKHLHSYYYWGYFINALITSIGMAISLTADQKKINIIPLISFIRAWNLARKSKYKRDNYVERFILENDIRCLTKKVAFHIGQKLLGRSIKRVFEIRAKLYPDYNEKYFQKWIPYDDTS